MKITNNLPSVQHKIDIVNQRTNPNTNTTTVVSHGFVNLPNWVIKALSEISYKQSMGFHGLIANVLRKFVEEVGYVDPHNKRPNHHPTEKEI